MMPIRNRKQVVSWCLFDFANSTYSAVIAAVVFPVYYASQIVGNDAGLGDLWWGRAVSMSMLVVALGSPVLGGIADYSGRRKSFLLVFTLLCVVPVSLLSILGRGMVVEGFLLVALANIGMEGGLVFYNSFLPLIAEPGYRGRVSSWGFGTGYAGSILSLLVALPLAMAGRFGLIWPIVAALFMIFSIPAFLSLPPDSRESRFGDSVSRGLRFTWETARGLFGDKESRKFLIAYFLYADGVSTVIVFSSLFASTTLGFGTGELIGLYILVQASALAGAFAMSRPVDYWGPRKVVLMSLVLWISVCVLAFFVNDKTQFWVLASVAGTGLGTVQAASRAFYSRFIPEGHESEYFGFYSLAGKSSAVFGPLMFGYVSSAWGSQRPAILAVALFFLGGFLMVRLVKEGGPAVTRNVKVPD